MGIVVASAGRPRMLLDVTMSLLDQSWPDFFLVLCVPTTESLPAVPEDERIVVITSEGGAAGQRNAGIEACISNCDLIFFFDDDALVHRDYLYNAWRAFDSNPGMAGMTGKVVLDGAVLSREISKDEASAAIRVSRSAGADVANVDALYGCNFGARSSVLVSEKFDTNLSAYSWLEDRDLSCRISKFGSLVRIENCIAVHRGAVSGGRLQHSVLGYSQIANPVYFWRSGSFTWNLAAKMIFPPVLSNLVGSLSIKHSRKWRRRRLLGNLYAIGHVIVGIIEPKRAADFASPG